MTSEEVQWIFTEFRLGSQSLFPGRFLGGPETQMLYSVAWCSSLHSGKPVLGIFCLGEEDTGSQATKIYHAYSLPAIVIITVEKPQSICLWWGAFIISCFPDYISLGIFSLWAIMKNCKTAFILFYFSWFGLNHSNNKLRPLKRTTCFSDQSAT